MPPVAEEEVPPPPYRFSPAALAGGEFGERAQPGKPALNSSVGEPRAEPPWRPSPRPSLPPEPPLSSQQPYFEETWSPEDDKVAPSGAIEEARQPVAEEPPELVPTPEPEAPSPATEHRAVAILKSGVVDGMSYTLYVDGSIEAELPQGTLRFASINDLREHLEKSA